MEGTKILLKNCTKKCVPKNLEQTPFSAKINNNINYIK